MRRMDSDYSDWTRRVKTVDTSCEKRDDQSSQGVGKIPSGLALTTLPPRRPDDVLSEEPSSDVITSSSQVDERPPPTDGGVAKSGVSIAAASDVVRKSSAHRVHQIWGDIEDSDEDSSSRAKCWKEETLKGVHVNNISQETSSSRVSASGRKVYNQKHSREQPRGPGKSSFDNAPNNSEIPRSSDEKALQEANPEYLRHGDNFTFFKKLLDARGVVVKASESATRDNPSDSGTCENERSSSNGGDGSALDADIVSKGSALHNIGECTPCRFRWTKRGCELGEECIFCHLSHAKPRRLWPRALKRNRAKRAANARQDLEITEAGEVDSKADAKSATKVSL